MVSTCMATYDPVCELFSYISINHCINRELSVVDVVDDLFKIHTLYASKIEMWKIPHICEYNEMAD